MSTPTSWCTLDALILALQASVHGPSPARTIALLDVSTDSRRLVQGELFVALRGEHFAGHHFAQQAVDRGAAALLIDTLAWQDLSRRSWPVPVVVVPDTLVALGQIAAWWRKVHGGQVVGVTGSNGKTTTKELLAAALTSMGPVHKTLGNLNNLIGLPLTLCHWRRSHPVVVAEMGMNRPGEIAQMAHIGQPNVGLVTCVAAAHLGGPGLGSLEAIAQAKSEMYANLPPDGICVLNQDDTRLKAAAAQVMGKRQVVTFGTDPQAHVRLLQVEQSIQGLRVQLGWSGKTIAIEVPLLGLHNGMNIAAAFAVACLCFDLVPEQVAQDMAQIRLPGARLQWRKSHKQDVAILDDTYNANPGSMEAACKTLVHLAQKRRSVAVFGDMLELGPDAPVLHQALGEAAARLGVGVILGVGEFAKDLVAGAKLGGGQGQAYAHHQALQPELWQWIQSGDMVLVKGSRGSHMETVVDWLVQGADA